MNSDQVRSGFLDFFVEKGHTVVPSDSLIPAGDPTLLLTSAGMVQFKPYYLGLAVPPNPRLASCQKCFRTTDIESVGDAQHLTFFEMLGNFSIGDYFKKEAIAWAWELLTQRLRLSPERLWATVYLDDDESFEYWRQTGVPEARIRRFGKEHNFWGPAGEEGPCGPCSEVHYDFGEELSCRRPTCGPNCDCGRFVEIWNLVFTQYNQDRSGKLTPLPRPNIDTGMGLERMAAVMQGVTTVYNTDLFKPLLERLSQISGHRYGQDVELDRAMRIVVEHGRGLTFLITDGVLPSNEGRGYILRRVLRRAVTFGRKLGLEEPFLTRIAEAAIARMGHAYPELIQHRDFVLRVIEIEEERFDRTLSTGLSLLDRVMAETERRGDKRIAGKEAFTLYDTYGFPPELTSELAGERGFTVDLEQFHREMEAQRERARAAHKFGLGEMAGADLYRQIEPSATGFVGYERTEVQARVIGLISNKEIVDTVYEGQEVEVILDSTPFYGEMGGQVGDTGEIRGPHGLVKVTDTVRPLPEIVAHRGRVVEGGLSAGDQVQAIVDKERRLDIARNHTATHLLQAALRKRLGSHVQQRGSLVTPERLRFDFTHLTALSQEDILHVQRLVNDFIRRNLPVRSQVIPYKEALESGVIALFGEKYGDLVRAIRVGEPQESAELCGGTHLTATGEIGFFLIVSEGSVGAGLRRIEAVTGRGAERLVEERSSEMGTLAQMLRVPVEAVPEKANSVLCELESEKRRAQALERELLKSQAEALAGRAQQVDGMAVLTARVSASSMESLRQIGDVLRDRVGSGIIVLGAVYNDRPNFLVMVTPDLVARGLNAVDIVKKVAQITGGGGGGKPTLAQAGGRDKARLDEALSQVDRIVAGKGPS